MRTVLYVSHTARLGGAELSLFGLLGALDRERYRPVLALPEWSAESSTSARTTWIAAANAASPPPVPDAADADLGVLAGRLGVEVWRLPLLPPRRPRWPWDAWRLWKNWKQNRLRVAELARRREAVLIHANSPVAAFQSAGAPIVAHWRDWNLPVPAAFGLSRHAVLTVVPSQALADRAFRAGLRAVRRVPNGIDLDHFRPADEVFSGGDGDGGDTAFAASPVGWGDRRNRRSRRLRLRSAFLGNHPEGGGERLPATPERPVLMVGQWVPWKRHDLFLQAMAYVRERRASARAWVAGGPASGKGAARLRDLRRMASGLGLDGVVEWLGPVPYRKMPALYRAASLVAHPAETEPWGRDVAEAMACGIPVAAARGGGPAELLSGGGGTLVPPGDPAALGRVILDYLDQPARRLAVGRVGRGQARAWSVERHAAAMMDIYDQFR